jgi:hypothetical protein
LVKKKKTLMGQKQMKDSREKITSWWKPGRTNLSQIETILERRRVSCSEIGRRGGQGGCGDNFSDLILTLFYGRGNQSS